MRFVKSNVIMSIAIFSYFSKSYSIFHHFWLALSLDKKKSVGDKSIRGELNAQSGFMKDGFTMA